MEIPMDLTPVLGGNMIRLDSARMKQLQNHAVYAAIDKMAELSARAMQLKKPLTTSQGIIDKPEQTLYLMWEKRDDPNLSYVLGYLKLGRKALFLYDKQMRTVQGKVRCVLDFYIHHSVQRKGYGHQLFEFMMQSERVRANQLALDNPSVTLLAFMTKHYDLDQPIWQNTNFVVYQEFFGSVNEGAGGKAVCDGWTRPDTPKKIDGGATESRWLGSCKDDKTNELSSTVMGELTTEGNMANRSQATKNRKQHILGHQPLW